MDVGEILLEQGLLDQRQLTVARDSQRNGNSLLDSAVEKLSNRQLDHNAGLHMVIDLESIQVEPLGIILDVGAIAEQLLKFCRVALEIEIKRRAFKLGELFGRTHHVQVVVGVLDRKFMTLSGRHRVVRRAGDVARPFGIRVVAREGSDHGHASNPEVRPTRRFSAGNRS